MRTGRGTGWVHAAAVLGGLALAASVLAGCGSDAAADGGGSGGTDGSGGSGGLEIVASTDVWGDVARQVGGDAVSVTSIIDDPSQDPHSYEADARTKLALSKADVVVENGGGYDDFVGRLLDGAGNDPTVVDAVTVSGKKAPAGGELNEHVWYDLPSVVKVADRLASVLAKAEPGSADRFRANAERFDAQVRGLEKTAAAIASAHRGEGVAITEPVPLYLLQACGLENKTPEAFSEAVEEGDDVPSGVLDDTLQLFRDKSVALLAYNEQTAGAVTDKVLAEAKADDVPVVPVTETLPAGKDYVGWMRSNLDAVQAALG